VRQNLLRGSLDRVRRTLLRGACLLSASASSPRDCCGDPGATVVIRVVRNAALGKANRDKGPDLFVDARLGAVIYVQMNWYRYQARVGNASLFVDRKSDSRWELWYTSPMDGHRKIGWASSPDRCMDLITPESLEAHGITCNPILFLKEALRWFRCSPSE